MSPDLSSNKKQILAFPALNGLRFILCLWVLGYHLLPIWTELFAVPIWFNNFLSHGYWAVDCFFVLSGFVITYAYGDILVDNRWPDFRTFLKRRLIRIYPLHILILLLLSGLVLVARQTGHPLHDENYTLSSFLENILLIQSWAIPAKLTWNHPAWAISIEWLLYLMTPFLLNVFYKPTFRVAMLRVILFLFLTVMYILLLRYQTHIQDAVLRGLAGFSCGIGLYKVYLHYPWKRPALFNIFTTPFMQRCGTLSFTIYMVQYPIILITRHALPPEHYQDVGLLYVISLKTCIFVVAIITHRTIEQPIQHYLYKV